MRRPRQSISRCNRAGPAPGFVVAFRANVPRRSTLDPLPAPKGRGSHVDPPNRFGGPYHVPDLEQVEHDADYLASLGRRPTEYLPDRSRSIVTENDSPDVGFRYSINPYRGCSHG